MKYLITFLFLLSVCTITHAQDFENPGDYMGFISKQQENISKKFMSYTSASVQ